MRKYLIYVVIVLAALLRLVNLDQYPSGLNADEAAIGYNAWSLLHTGRDEHNTKWPMVFRSFDDYKPAVYFYLVLPFVKVLGLNVWAVRLPSALLGIASVYLVYLIVNQLIVKKLIIPGMSRNPYKNLPLLSAFLLATSPWHLQFSRGGWEVNTSTFFILLGVYGFFRVLGNRIHRGESKYFFLFVFSLVLSLYTYHSSRLISPLLALVLISTYRKDLFCHSGHVTESIWGKYKHMIISFSLGILLCLPLAGQMLSKAGQSRFSGVSVFSDEGPVWEALELRRQHQQENLYTRYLHSRYVTYSLRFTKNYLSHFSPRFLFLTGDEIARSKVPEVGQSLLILFPFFFLGVFQLLKLNTRWKKFILAWFLISPIAASLTFQAPHALRSQNMVIPLSIITALGVAVFFEFIKKYKLPYRLFIFCVFGFLSFFSVAQYLHQYFVHYPQELPYAWQYGFNQVAEYTKANYQNYDHIIISDRYDQPYILMAFFLQYPPEVLQKEIVLTPRDKFGFSTVRNFGKYEFRLINWEIDKKLSKTLIMAADEPVDETKVIHTIVDPSGKTLYKFLRTEN